MTARLRRWLRRWTSSGDGCRSWRGYSCTEELQRADQLHRCGLPAGHGWQHTCGELREDGHDCGIRWAA